MSSPTLWYLTRASGIVTLALLTATTLLGIITANRMATARWPGFALQDVHRRVSGIAMTFLALHVVTSVLDSYVHIGWAAIVVPFASSYHPGWVAAGTISVDLLLAVGVTSVLRHRICPRTWRVVHWLAYLSWPVALTHAFGMGTDMRTGWATAFAATCIGLVAAAAMWRITSSGARRRRAAALGAFGRRPSDVPVKHLSA